MASSNHPAPSTPRLPLPLLRRIAGAGAYGAGVLVVVALGGAVYVDSALVRLDLAVVRGLHQLASHEGTAVATGATELAATHTILLVGFVATASLLLRGNWHGGLALIASIGATQAIVYSLKGLVDRARPPASSALVDAAGHAFPSAHAASSVALYGLLALLVLRRLEGRVRIVAAVLALVFLGSLGLTRVYLGAHYPSDVLAGWLVGGLVAAAAWRLGRGLSARLPRFAVAS